MLIVDLHILLKRYFCAMRQEFRAVLNVIQKNVGLVEGATVVTPSSVVFRWYDGGRSQLEGKAMLLQKPTL